ncbi:hypothetical protein B0H66DRAFT_639558 [Apodospora peruviana]|uniref:Uncharacterized protein n=1 Tax=Apodospora peruviana TaxID=516989 RepID=A0AAE0I3Y3_9PEZI|nr:hypothetical protein B0H66DRAFT_639558 [Apodospora peruviana]
MAFSKECVGMAISDDHHDDKKFLRDHHIARISGHPGPIAICEHENHPLFTIQRHGAWGGGPDNKPMIVLHEGTDPKALGPVVGTVTKSGLMKHDTVIELRGTNPIREPLFSDVSMTLKNSRFTFSFDVGRQGKETHRETFEWRISKAVEVRTLDNMAFGWKLVRLDPTVPDQDQQSTVTAGRGRPSESPGCG